MNNPYRVRETKVKKRVKMIAVTANPIDVVNTVTGEVQRATPYVGNRRFRDIGEFTKVYRSDVVYGLSVYAFRVMFYIFEIMDFEGGFRLDADECAKKIGIKRRMVYYGLKELREKDVIRKDSWCKYWFNPNIAFRGSRDELLDFSLPKHEERDSIH